MHVLVLPKWYPGRPDPQLGDFIRKQMLAVAERHKVSVIYPCPVKDLENTYEEVLDESAGAWELRCYYRPSTLNAAPLRKAVNFFLYRRTVRSGIDRLIRERGLPDLIHAHILTRPVWMAWRLSRKWGVPFVSSEQSSVHLDGTWMQKSPVARATDRFLFKQAAALTAVSPHLAAALVKADLGTTHAVVPNVVPGMDRALTPRGPAGHFMMVADLVDRTKNVSGVLRALATARAQGHDFKLEIIGDGPDRNMLHALAEQLGIEAQVRWHGRLAHADVLPALASTGTVIINSNFETFSVVTGEALASGKPVIATRCGGPEAFITAQNGMLIPVADDDALTQAMVRIAKDHANYAPATVRESVSHHFSPKAVADGFDAVYQKALANG